MPCSVACHFGPASDNHSPVFLNLSNALRKSDKMLGFRHFFSTSLIDSNNQDHSCKFLYLCVSGKSKTEITDMHYIFPFMRKLWKPKIPESSGKAELKSQKVFEYQMLYTD